MSSYFPERQYIESIRRALWAEPGSSRAAVMIGSGMSRNADPLRLSGQTMATWEDLITRMIDRLYPPSTQSNRHRAKWEAQAGATSAALRLADEYAAAFGRAALDDLILQAVPDANFAPGKLHRLLMELPWSDVLTTNYDTLLERAATGGIGQKYSVIRSVGEIPAAVRPRIVKLHGSFPSTRPFIITEEDFRTYPRKFSPFVNLAQQVVMENVLCLIGFSGDDPNFLYWSGWVRDHLGDYAPKIYLCGLLNLSDSERVLLQSRNVVPIDLTPLFPYDQFPDAGNRHQSALEWLLISLRNGRPNEVLEWPDPPASSAKKHAHLPELLPHPRENVPLRETQFPPWPQIDQKAVNPLQSLIEELSIWKHNRHVYPGWLIAPNHIRKELWDNTQNWIGYYLQNYSVLHLLLELEFLSELNWRLETALMPIPNEMISAYKRVLDDINPFPKDITDLHSASMVFQGSTAQERDWSSVRKQWLSLAFAQMRYYREERRASDFEIIHSRLERLKEELGDFKARWCHERCLFAFSELDDESVILALDQWPIKTDDIFWSARKAAILAELGRTDEALELSSTALSKLQEGLADSTEHIPSLSREGWVLLLTLALRSDKRFGGNPDFAGDELSDRAEARRRINQLKIYGCSPREIKDYLEGRLEQGPPQPIAQSTTTPSFEPGTYSTTFRSGTEIGPKLIPAYQYARLVEEAAHPPDLGRMNLCHKVMFQVAEWFQEHDPVRTQSIMFRLRDSKLIENYLSRHRIASFSLEALVELSSIAMRGITQCLPKIPTTHLAEEGDERRNSKGFECALELIARVCMRTKEDDLTDLWKLACTIYRHPATRVGLVFDRPVKLFFSSLITASPPSFVHDQLRALFQLPIPGELDYSVRQPDHWPDPATMAAQNVDGPLWKRPPANWKDIKSRLFEVMRIENSPAKRTAFLRLYYLNELGVLSASEQLQLSKVFWEPVTEVTGLPIEAWQHGTPWFALNLVEPKLKQIDPCERVKTYILERKLGQIQGGVMNPEEYLSLVLYATAPSDRDNDSLSRRWHIEWTREDIQILFQTIRSWWESHGRGIAENKREVSWWKAHYGQTTRKFVNGIWDVLRIVIIPRISSNDLMVPELMALIEDMKRTGLPIAAVLPATLMLRPKMLEGVKSELRQEFANPELEFYLSALRGIVYWVQHDRSNTKGKDNSLPAAPPDLLREMSMSIALRRPESLRLSLDAAFHVLHELAGNADRQFIRNIIIGLDYLLTETCYRPAPSPLTRFSYDELPHIRQLAARLAYELSICGHGEDPTIQRWSEAITSDPLPEIRRVKREST